MGASRGESIDRQRLNCCCLLLGEGGGGGRSEVDVDCGGRGLRGQRRRKYIHIARNTAELIKLV